MTRNQRLKEFLAYKKVTQEQFGVSIAAKQSQVANWFGGEKIPSQRLIDIIEAYSDLNARWLISGNGEMLEGTTTNEVNEPNIPGYGKILEMFEAKFEAKYDAKAEECGMLKERIRYLTEELKHLKKNVGHGYESKHARTG